jgi:hypothetical protein
LPQAKEDDGVACIVLVEQVEESRDQVGVRGWPGFLR